jgi:hypothetical protein
MCIIAGFYDDYDGLFCCRKILFMLVCEVQLYMLMHESR